MSNILLIYPNKKKPQSFHRLLELGHKIIAVTIESNHEYLYPLCEQVIVINPANPIDNSQDILKKLNTKVDGVIAFSDEGMLIRDALVDTKNWKGISYKTSLSIKDKQSFRTICRNAGITVPKSTKIKDKNDIPSQNDLPLPWIVKPIMGVGSRSVKKIDTQEQLQTFLDNVDWNLYPKFVVEEYLPGNEVDIDMLVQSGKVKFISIYDNHSWKKPYFMQLAGNIPSLLPKEVQQQLTDMAYALVKTTKITDACLHLEAMATNDFVFPIELNVRMGGAETHTFNKGVYGVDLIEMIANIATGEKIPNLLNLPIKSHMRARAFMPKRTGTLITKNIDPEIFTKPYLDEFHFFHEVGDEILSPPDGFALMGWFTVKAETDREAQKYIAEVLEMVEYEIVE